MGFFRSCSIIGLTLAVGFSSLMANDIKGKKVLLIDSYHEGYGWSDGIVNGAKKVLDGAGVQMQVFRMDSKDKPGEKDKVDAAKRAVEAIAAFKPDVIIAADDNAQKYIIVPTYKDKEIPVVFCGINWDASAYGFPTKNVTGMIEVSPYTLLEEKMKPHAKGDKVGFLGVNNETSKKEAENTEKLFKVSFEKRYANTFEEWKKYFLELQASCGWVYLENNAGLQGWDDAEAAKFALENTTVPTGAIYDWLSEVSLLAMAKSGEEQGEWSAAAAIKILKGTAVSDIPVARNKKGDLFLNMKIAQKLGVTFDLGLVKIAKKVIR